MLDDLRLAWRRLRSAPGFALAAVVTLALAVGANTAIFTVADAVLFRPLPYADPDRLFLVRNLDRQTGRRSPGIPFEIVEALQQRHSGIEGVALRSPTIMSIHAGPDGAEFVERLSAAQDYFRVLGVRPALGRVFEAGDIGSAAAMLTYESWQTRLGGNEGIVGRELDLGGDPHVIVGILPPRFIFPSESQMFYASTTGRAEWVNVSRPRRPGSPLPATDTVVRLKPGVTRDQAQAELDVLAESIAARQPQAPSRQILLEDVRSVLFPTGRDVLQLLLIAAGLVLLIGCANLANLLLARMHRRERELAVHAALGASPMRLVRPVVFETLLVGSAAALVALVVSVLTFDALQREVPPVAYGRAFIGVDVRVVIFTLALGLTSGVVLAASAAWRVLRVPALSVLIGSYRQRRRTRVLGRPMIALQVGVSIVLVVGAISAARRFVGVLDDPLGFNPDNLIAFNVSPGRLEGRELHEFLERAVATVEQQPDVISAGAGRSRPFDRISPRPAEAAIVSGQEVPVVPVLPGYLETLGVRLTQGRLPRRVDVEGDLEPAILTASAARMLAPDVSIVGATVPLKTGGSARVIGVIDDVMRNVDSAGPAVYLVPRTLEGRTILARTRARSVRTLTAIRRAVVAVAAPSDPVQAAWVIDAINAQSRRDPRFQTLLLSSFAVMGLGLAALGIFAMVAANVALRMRELGVRLAIGASPQRLLRFVLTDAFKPVAVGIVAGAAAAFLIARVVSSRIAGMEPASWDALALAIVTVLAAAVTAAYWPARRVSRVDPVLVLRAE
jgi:predicted permease